MIRKILSITLVMTLLSTTVVPMNVYAAPSSWAYYKDGLIGSLLGALDGYLQTDDMGGALAGSLKGFFSASTLAGVALTASTDEAIDEPQLGDFHNVGLMRLYQQFQLNSSELSVDTWHKIDRAILTYVWENRLYTRALHDYIGEMDFSNAAMLERIKTATTKNEQFPISENFYPTLERALAILDQDSENPGELIEAFNTLLLESAVKESGESLSPKNNDIILAELIAHFSKKGYDYYKSRSDSSLDSMDIIILVPKRAQIGQPDIVETHIPQRIKGLEILIDKVDAQVGIDQVTLDVAPFIENDRTMVPFRFIGESLGAQIQWDPDEFSVTYILDDKTIKLYIGKNTALVNGEEISIDENINITPRIVNARTMVPIRFISEALGFDVSWDPERRAVSIMNNPYFTSNDLSGDMLD